MRVTGRTLDGEPLTITCPAWCTDDHASELNRVDDLFHHSDQIMMVPPPDASPPIPEYALVPQMAAYLMAHSTDTAADMKPCIYLHLDPWGDQAAQLDVAGADEVLAELDAYREQLMKLRNQLAEEINDRA